MIERTNRRRRHMLLLLIAAGVSACATTARQRVVRAPVARCADESVQVYFEPDSAELTAEGRAVVAAAATQAKGCRVAGVDVTGLADAAGAPGANLELSQKRAASVAAALKAAGLPAAEFKVAAAGQAGAQGVGGKTQPMRRRADILLRLAAP